MMKYLTWKTMTVTAIVLTMCIAGFLAAKYLGKDSSVEEIAEEIIEDQIGVDIDFSPDGVVKTNEVK
jgi:hypothetical protein